MATTVSYSASLRTRKKNSSSNYNSSAAAQEFYVSDSNFCGIISFPGLSLTNKIITAISLKCTSTEAGYGAGHTKTVYVRKSNYQTASQSGITGAQYAGEALGTFKGSFYGNTTTCNLSGDLLANLAAYFQQGNNTFCIYNPSPTASSQGYSGNYLQWKAVTVTITYEEGVSQPSTDVSGYDMGTPITIRTNRMSENSTHTLSYAFGSQSGVIAENVGDSYDWTPPVTLAQELPTSTSGYCVINCDTYYEGVLTGSGTCGLYLIVPSSIVPTVTGLSCTEAGANLISVFGGYVQSKSRAVVSVTAAGAHGSTIESYRTVFAGNTYTAQTFTSGYLNTSGTLTLAATVIDSRGRSASATATVVVLPYSAPQLSLFTAERCTSDGSAPQMDGVNVRISASASVSPVENKNTIACEVFYKLSTAQAWISAGTLTSTNYAVAQTNTLLAITLDTGYSYDLKLRVTDYFCYVEQTARVGTKQVMVDFFRDGSGIAFGKIAEAIGAVEMGWPLHLDTPLGVQYGGTGANNGTDACNTLGAVPKTGGTMTGNLNIQGQLYPSMYLLPTYNGTENRTVFEGSYAGESSFASWQDSTGNNRRMLSVRNANYEPSLDNAALLRVAINGVYYAYRLFHSGMTSPIPVANGGTGAANGKDALANLGVTYAYALPASGVDGQIVLVPAGTVP